MVLWLRTNSNGALSIHLPSGNSKIQLVNYVENLCIVQWKCYKIWTKAYKLENFKWKSHSVGLVGFLSVCFFFNSHIITYIFLNYSENYSILLIACYDLVFMVRSRIHSLQWNTTKYWHLPALVLLLDILKIPFPSVDDYGLFA